MALAFLIEEDLRGPLPAAIRAHNAAGIDQIDALAVGEPLDLPLGTKDPDILLWAEAAGRILVSHDKKTMLTHLQEHLHAGHHCPGILIVRSGATLPNVVHSLAVAAHAGKPTDFLDQIDFIPY